jgi:hypothetical protein
MTQIDLGTSLIRAGFHRANSNGLHALTGQCAFGLMNGNDRGKA